jgi:hypothetical protein
MFENRVLKKIFGSNIEEGIGPGENWILRSFMICTPHQIYVIRVIKLKDEMGRACGMYGSKIVMCGVFWWGNLKGRDHLENVGIDFRIISKLIIKT